jgi:hypothetical protein
LDHGRLCLRGQMDGSRRVFWLPSVRKFGVVVYPVLVARAEDDPNCESGDDSNETNSSDD